MLNPNVISCWKLICKKLTEGNQLENHSYSVSYAGTFYDLIAYMKKINDGNYSFKIVDFFVI